MALAALGLVLVLGVTSCDGGDITAKVLGEASEATAAADAARAAVSSGEFKVAASDVQTADSMSEEAIDNASSASISPQTKDTVATARSDALGAETVLNADTVPVSDTAYDESVRSSVRQAICAVITNAESGNQQPDPQQWTQDIDNLVQSNLQNAAGGAVPGWVVQGAITAVDQYVNPWVEKFNALVNFDPGALQSWLQASQFLC